MLLPTPPSLRQYLAQVFKQSLVTRKHAEEREKEKERETDRRN